MTRSKETAIRNELLFRDANQAIAERRDELATVDGLTPFLCECEEETCTAIVQLTAADYRRVRADADTFVIVPGHETIGKETDLHGDGWMCVSKAGML
jgi:hypothetical protein